MEHNLNIYGISLRYALMAVFGIVGGLFNTQWFGMLFLGLAVYFFLLGILAFDPILFFLKKNQSKSAVEDFK